MLGSFDELLLGDRILIVAFILFSLYILACLTFMSREYIKCAIRRRMARWLEKLEHLRDTLERDEEYDPEWMDEEKWREAQDG